MTEDQLFGLIEAGDVKEGGHLNDKTEKKLPQDKESVRKDHKFKEDRIPETIVWSVFLQHQRSGGFEDRLRQQKP